MDALYVVELDVAPAPTPPPAPDPEPETHPADGAAWPPPRGELYGWLIDHIAAWLTRGSAEVLDLSTGGRAETDAEANGRRFTRRIRWTVTETAVGVRALHVVMRQPLEAGQGAEFISEVYLFDDGERMAVRVDLGRESVDGLMAPVSVQGIRRPGLLVELVRDPRLVLTYQRQHITGRFEWINRPQAAVAKDAIASSPRLPVLLVDGDDPDAKRLGRAAAAQMTGLVQVLLVGRTARPTLDPYLASIGADLRSGHARLVWPTLESRHPEFFDLGEVDRIVGLLMRLVAPVSVAARGFNRLRHLAAEAARKDRDAALQRAMADAAASGDVDAEVSALRERLEALQAENNEWIEEAQRLTDAYEAALGQASSLEITAAHWKGEAERAWAAIGTGSSGSSAAWEEAPELTPEDLTPLADFLAGLSDGAIVFTPRAERAWRKSGYPHVEAMRAALITLARAATDYRARDCEIGGRLKDWLKLNYGLNYAPSDSSLDEDTVTFEYDKRSYSREHHLKLDDGTTANEVGRVYFAVDPDKARFIVDHPGLHL